MKKYLSVIMKCPVFEGISENDVLKMLKCMNAVTTKYSKNEYIIHFGDSVTSIGLVADGAVTVTQDDFWGNRNLLARIESGDIFAESFAFSSEKSNVDVIADEDSKVIWLDVGNIIAVCPSSCDYHARLIKNLLSTVSEKNLRLNKKLTHMGQRTTKEKLMSFLSSQGQQLGSNEFDISFSRQELADYLSVERSAMSAELSKLRDEGLIKYNKNHFVILK